MDNALYDYWPVVDRPVLSWPGEAKVAFWLGLNVEYHQIDKPSTSLFPSTANLVPDPLNYGWRDYGVRVGMWRIMDALDRHGVPASVLLNSDVCRHYPQIIEAGNERKWAWLAHGQNNSILQTGFSLNEERQYLAEMVRVLRESTGTQPHGWLGPALTETFATPGLLAELGLSYLLDWCNDDQPYPLNVKGARMISLPYSIEVNDAVLCVGRNLSGEDFYRLVMDQLEGLVAAGEHTGQVMAIGVHPFVLGQPFRLKYLDRVLRQLAATQEVWITTSDEIAETYLAEHYDAAVASLHAANAVAGTAG
ncbi:MAG TPA: polysaccharide deacetylase family protein [Acidothermaceae bacterium]